MSGTLYLLPNLLGEQEKWEAVLPASVSNAVTQLDGLIAESEKGGRYFLRRFPLKKPLQQMPIALLNEHTQDKELAHLLEPVKRGETWGVVSDAGLPCLADPGSALVLRAHQLGIRVVTFPGPSSVTHALILSGLPGQRFAFHGYLNRERAEHLLTLERRSQSDQATQLFIETPYRNLQTAEAALSTLSPDTLFCIAWDLTLPTECVITQPIQKWRQSALPDIHKKPAIFLLFRPSISTKNVS